MKTPGVECHVRATPAEVFDVLADGWLYPLWVVGASRMREVDDNWPADGARLHHSIGIWPLLLDDETTLVEWQAGSKAVLEAKGRPLGTATVVLTAEPDGAGGSRLRLVEDASRGPALLLPKPLRQALMLKRNTEALRRLAHLVDGRSERKAA